MKNDRGSRKQYMYGGATAAGAVGGAGTATGTTGGYASKFNSTMFGQTLLKSMGQKENTSASQAFPTGFSKYIGDGSQNDKVDPHQLPMALKDHNSNSKFGVASSVN